MDEPFTLVARTTAPSGSHSLFDDVVRCNSARSCDNDLQYVAALRQAFPEMIVTVCSAGNAPLLAFAAAGNARCTLDKGTDSFAGWRGYVPPARRLGKGAIGQAVDFAKYSYRFGDEDFIVYLVGRVHYILKEPRDGEERLGPSKLTDGLIFAAGEWITTLAGVVWVYDGWWRQDADLFAEVQKASWDKVILDEGMKRDLTTVANKFFDSEDVYRDLGVPWKRGLLFHGPPGNGKTISIKALSHDLYDRKRSIPTLYVKSAPYTSWIGEIFAFARSMAPCMLVFEDVETIVTEDTRSYFFNEMDGLNNNDGLFIVGSTNFLERLDPGLTKRPSRFDRKYLFPMPNEHERTLYCEFWRNKLRSNQKIVFPEKLCPAMASITPGFSFAFLQECFVATLLVLATEETEMGPYDDDNNDDLLDKYELWKVFKKQAESLRKEIDAGDMDRFRASDSHRSSDTRRNRRTDEQPGWMRPEGWPHAASAQPKDAHSRPQHHARLLHVEETWSNSRTTTRTEESDALPPELPYGQRKGQIFNPFVWEMK